jgi:hypothetical protein
MSFIQEKDKITISVDTYQITKTAANSMLGDGSTFWTIRLDGSILIKISETEANSENKIKALGKWLFSEISEKIGDRGLNIQWFSQYDEVFKNESCWSAGCCGKAAKRILGDAGATPGDRLIIAHTNNRLCEKTDTNGNKQIVRYDNSGLVANEALFEEAIQVIDTSLKKHKLPIMIGVQHPYWNDDDKVWYYKCGHASNSPRATNHFVVIVGDGYDNTKKMRFYYFYEVGTEDPIDGQSKNNKLWIDTKKHLIVGNTAISSKTDYYIATDIRTNQGKIYNK